ncbi:MAG TPA: DNA polymerase III subunit gamma/tau [Planctomycetota bacterium]|nr:DNA polymerase III subunit gamma/tau [Planctomycetota bacterium]
MAKKSAKPSDEAPPKKGAASKSDAAVAERPSAYVVFARRFRPNNFAEVAGQTAITGALKQALNTGRIAQAYLFCGPRGVGKTSLARILAKALNCLNGKGPGGVSDEPCNECDACQSIQAGRALDVIEMDAATNRGIEEVRALRDNVGLAPAELRYKVYIIDEVHMLTKEAWNAFLKTLEEPPPHVKFVFATTDPNNVPETILSRCQRYDLRRIGPADIVKRLKQICELENVQFDEMALSRIAGLARGGLRDAEGLLDQAVNLGQGKVTDEVVRDLSGATPDELILDMLKDCAAGQTAGVLQKAHTAIEAGADPEDILASLTERLRAAMLARVCGPDTPLLEGQTHLKEAYVDLGTRMSDDQMMMLIQLFTAARIQMREVSQTRLPLEMALIRASKCGDLVDLSKLVGALEQSRPAPAGPPRPGGPAPTPGGGQRPNSAGRPEGIAESRQAADAHRQGTVRGVVEVQPTAANAGFSRPTAPVAPPQNDVWSAVVAAVRAMKGGVMLASGLNYAANVKLDVNAGTLKLGFATEQLLYKEPLERAEGRASVQAALQSLFKKDFQITIERVSANSGERTIIGAEGFSAPASKTTALPTRPSTPLPEPHQSADDSIEIDCTEEPDAADVEFGDAGELPLPTPPPVSRTESVPTQTDDDADGSTFAQRPAVLRPAAFEKSTMADAAGPVDVKTVQDHPLVKLVLKETAGDIKRVTRSGKKT